MALHPEETLGGLLLGLAVAAMGEDARAAPILVAAAATQPTADHPCLDLARLELALPRALVARQFERVCRLAPGDDRLRLDFAGFLLDNGQVAEAEAVLADGPTARLAIHLRGLVRGELGHLPLPSIVLHVRWR